MVYLPLETYVRICYDISMKNLKSVNKQQQMMQSITKADFVLIVGCLFVAFLLTFFFMVHRRTGSTISISCDGVELYRIELEDIHSDGQTQYYLIQSKDAGQDVHIMHFEQYPSLPAEQNYNLFSVTDGIVTMEAADCKDQICVRHTPIGNDRESIICLPNKIVIEISSESDEPLDGVVG